MPTNANTFNSRVTSEALEAKFRQVFPAQGGAELVQDLFASGVIQPVIDFSAVAEGSALRSDLQTSWDFATSHNTVSATTTTIISNPGFWKVDLNVAYAVNAGTAREMRIFLNDGATSKVIWELNTYTNTTNTDDGLASDSFIVFVRSGDIVRASTTDAASIIDVWYRQIADVYGNLTQPLGYVSS